jgi:hypothetical protein
MHSVLITNEVVSTTDGSQTGHQDITTVPLNRGKGVKVRIIVFNTTFNNISVILWQSLLMVEKTGVPREITTCRESLISLSHTCNVESSTPYLEWEIQTTI